MVDASRVLDEFDRYMANGSGLVVSRGNRPTQRIPARPDRLLLRRVRHPRVDADLLRRPRHPGRRPLQVGSDAALPFVGVGLLYRRGYFRQQIDADGHQQHAQPDLDPPPAAAPRARPRRRRRSRCSVDFPDRKVRAAVWVAQVGRVPLLLLDTDIPANERADRPITHILYVRGREMRLCQELDPRHRRRARAASARDRAGRVAHQRGPLGLAARWSGHASSSRPSRRSPPRRRCGASAATVFTIHTPVPAGNEQFERGPARRHLAPGCDGRAACRGGAAGARRGRTDDPDGPFDMTAFVLRMSARANGVSRAARARPPARLAGASPGAPDLGHHQRRPRRHLDRPAGARASYSAAIGVPLGAIAAGPEASGGARGGRRRGAVGRAPAAEARADRVHRAAGWRARSRATAIARAACASCDGVLDPEALTIGFARRFATYKRADLLFRDVERLARILLRRRAAGADRHRRQGASRRPARAATDPAHLRAVAHRSDSAAGSSSSRTTTSASRACWSRRGRLAEQPAAAAGGVGHAAA